MRQKRNYPVSGERYGLWTVIGNQYVSNDRYEKFIQCRCDCGTVKYVKCKSLAYKESRSCTSCAHRVHGDRNKRLYRIWRSIKQRCNDENHEHYNSYGGRGIKICPEWERSYEAFRKHALKTGYSDELEIDRIDVDGDYEPGNIRWVTRGVNARNRRCKKEFSAFGEKKTIHEWSLDPRCIVDKKLLIARVYTNRWSTESAMTTPRKSNRYY